MIETLITVVIVLIAIILAPFTLMMGAMAVILLISFIMLPFEHIKMKRGGKR